MPELVAVFARDKTLADVSQKLCRLRDVGKAACMDVSPGVDGFRTAEPCNRFTIEELGSGIGPPI